MLNSIRPDALASLLLKGEAETGNRPVKGERQFRDLSLESTVSSKIGMHGVTPFNPGDGIRWISDAVWALSADSPNATGRQAGLLEAPVNSRRIRDF
jgi:hypothetical protein